MKRLTATVSAIAMAAWLGAPAHAGHNEPVTLPQLPYAPVSKTGDTMGPLILSQTLALPTLASTDLTYAGIPNPNALKMANGFAVSFCPALSCVNSSSDNPNTPNSSFFDHQRANLLLSGATQDDGHSEEQNLAVITTIATGYSKKYTASTAYSVGDNIAIGNAVYRAIVAGTTGASSAPPGTRPTTAQGGNYTVTDGTVTWKWINDAAIDAKVGSYFETQVLSGAGAAWGAAFNYHIKTTPLAGMFLPGIEMDYANDSGTACGLGVTDCTALRLALGGSAITEGLQITGNAPGAANFSSIWALRINGDMVASQSAIEIDASAPVGIGFGISGLGGASHSIAAAWDASVSPVSFLASGTNATAAFQASGIGNVANTIGSGFAVTGSYQNGLSLSGTFNSAQIAGNNFVLYPNGSMRISNNNASNSSLTGALQIPNGGLGVGGAGYFGGLLSAAGVVSTISGGSPSAFSAQSPTPVYEWSATTQAVDAKNWQLAVFPGTVLGLMAVNDAKNVGNYVWKANRGAGAAVANLEVVAPLVLDSSLQFGTYTAGAATSTGYISITDAGGTVRHLAVVP